MRKIKYIDPFSPKVRDLAKQFDDVTAKRDVSAIENLIDVANSMLPTEDRISQAQLYYSIATAYSDIEVINQKHDENSIKKQLYNYRKSIETIENEKIYKRQVLPYVSAFKCILYINYANLLNACGRKISAIEQYEKALNINPEFGMALGNLGRAYWNYAMLLQDYFYKECLHYHACDNLMLAIDSSDKNTPPSIKEEFRKFIQYYSPEYIQYVYNTNLEIPQKEYEDSEESLYRVWGLENKLFLNPLVDLPLPENYFANDEIQLPDMIAKIGDHPIPYGFFNQIKQEYIYARYLYYSTLKYSDSPHFADKDTFLVNTPDAPQYSIRIENLKASFKTLYGLFDKIAYFLNSYFKLGIHERDVSFNSIWLNSHGREGKPGYYTYENTLKPTKNIALFALYWIEKDFVEKFEDSPNPFLKRIKEVRNALEHKYVKIIDDKLYPDYQNDKYDSLALYVSEHEFYKITMELLKILREAIICLSLCVGIEETNKRTALPSDIAIPKINFETYEDKWKI